MSVSRGAIGWALVGCGKVSGKHAQVLQSLRPDANLVAVCDVDLARAQKFAREHGGVAYQSIEEMVTAHRGQIDAVTIATPSGFHAQNVLEAVDMGIRNIIVEKPIALRLDDAERIVRLCEDSGVRLFVVKQNRYNRAICAAADAMRRGRFGRIVTGSVRLRWCRTQQYYDEAPWRGTWEMDGGVFSNQAIHFIDLLLWLVGDVESVFAYTANRLASIEAEDTGVAALRFRNGALGIVEATSATRPKDLEGSISVLGERGAAVVGGFAANSLQTYQFSDEEPWDAIFREDRLLNPKSPIAYAHYRYLQGVIRTIRTDGTPAVSGPDGLASLRLLHAIYESAMTRREVLLDGFRPVESLLGRRPLETLTQPTTRHA